MIPIHDLDETHYADRTRVYVFEAVPRGKGIEAFHWFVARKRQSPAGGLVVGAPS